MIIRNVTYIKIRNYGLPGNMRRQGTTHINLHTRKNAQVETSLYFFKQLGTSLGANKLFSSCSNKTDTVILQYYYSLMLWTFRHLLLQQVCIRVVRTTLFNKSVIPINRTVIALMEINYSSKLNEKFFEWVHETRDTYLSVS